MKLEHLLTYRADLKAPVEVGAGPFGTRTIFDVTGGTAEGPRLRGRLLASGGDWLLVDANGTGFLDVRGTLETDDGARIYIHYHGVLVLREEILAALARGEATDFGDSQFWVRMNSLDSPWVLDDLIRRAVDRVVAKQDRCGN